MPNLFSIIRYERCLPALVLGSVLLLGCSKSPESAGKDIASKTCDCISKKTDSAYKNTEQLQKDLEGGKYKTQSEVTEVMLQLNKETMRSDSACMATPNALTMQAQVDFVKPEEQATFVNAMRANYAQCQQERTEKVKSRTPINIVPLISKLPLGQSNSTNKSY